MKENGLESPEVSLSPDTLSILTSNSKFSSAKPRKSFGVIVDRVEVYNSVEVNAPGIESQPQDLVKQYRVGREESEQHDWE